jgi:hypothetical protein
MPQRIKVSSMINNADEEFIFTIRIPVGLINNPNFFETMQSFEFSNPVSWLLALANAIENAKGKDNA